MRNLENMRNYRQNRKRPAAACPIPGCETLVNELGAYAHLRRRHKGYKPVDPQVSEQLSLFTLANRMYIRNKQRNTSKARAEAQNSQATGLPSPEEEKKEVKVTAKRKKPDDDMPPPHAPLPTYVPPSRSSLIKPIVRSSVRRAMREMPLASGDWTVSFNKYLTTTNENKTTVSEYETLGRRVLGYARHFRGMGLVVESDSALDLSEGGFLDHQALCDFRVFLESGICPSPSFSSMLKHIEALRVVMEWRVSAAPHPEEAAKRKSLYATVLDIGRNAFRKIAKNCKKATQRKNTVAARKELGKHVEPNVLRQALQHALDTWWKASIDRSKRFTDLKDVIQAEEKGHIHNFWSRLIGLMFVAFYSHHPNRPQALIQIRLKQYLSGEPIPFKGKTELSSGPQMIVFAPPMRQLIHQYVKHLLPLVIKGDPTDESPLFPTLTGRPMQKGTPAKCIREFCAVEKEILGEGVKLTSNDCFKIFSSEIAENTPDKISDILKARGTSEAVFRRNYELSRPDKAAARSNTAYQEKGKRKIRHSTAVLAGT